MESNNDEDREHSRVRRAADDCPPGFYKNNGGCALCEMGFYCTGVQAGPVACNWGQYSGMGASSCSNCADLTTQGKIFLFIMLRDSCSGIREKTFNENVPNFIF